MTRRRKAAASGRAAKAQQGEPTKLDVYYDGDCPMCASLMSGVRGSPKAGAFGLHDMRRARSMPFARDAVERQIHVTDAAGEVHRGPDAILLIAEQYPRLAPLARAARAPPLFIFAPLVYRFVAANRRFLWGPASRLYWLKAAVLLTLAIQLAMSAPLWIGPRSYPLTPVFDGLPPLPDLVSYGLYAGLFIAAAAALAVGRPQRWLAALVSILAAFVLFDQTRLQAWIFQLAFLAATLALFSWRGDDVAGRERALNTARLIIVATYVYSGLQKLNANFVESDFPWIAQPITNLVPQAAGAVHAFGMAAPFLQVGFGLGLATRRLRRISLILAVAMHVFILAMLGPLGQNWNAIVWPWTSAMAVFDILLFGGQPRATPAQILWPGRRAFPAAVLVIFGVLPALSFFNRWDSALSAALYSGNVTDAVIYVNDAGRAALPPPIRRHLVHTSADTNVLNLQRWASEDLGVVPYSETRIFKRIARSVCARLPDPADLMLEVHERRLFFSQPETDYRCWELGGG